MNKIPVMIAVHAAQQQEAEAAVLDAFRLAGATAPERAQPLARLNLVHGDAITRLEERGLLRATGRDRYYLDEAAVVARRTGTSTSTAAWIIGGLLVLSVLLVVVGLWVANR